MIALYRGISCASRVIRWKTWSAYSHASWLAPDFSREIEAWKGEVREQSVPFAAHTPGTVADLFEFFEGAADADRGMAHFLREQIGKPYDWPGILGFATRRQQSDLKAQAKWFCSELVFAAAVHAERPLLLRVQPWQVYPGMIAYSTQLRFVRSCVVPDYQAMHRGGAEGGRP